jgi:VanZ family protein
VYWKRIEQRILQSKWLSDPVLWLLFLWGLFIVYATLLPFDFSASRELVQQRLRRLWARPLKGGSWVDVQGNVLLFVPWGLLLATALARRGARFSVTLAAATCTGAFLSGSVEVIQLFAPSRTSSVIDLVTNSFGATVGALIGWPWVRLIWPVLSIRLRQWITTRPLATCALLTAGFLFLAGLSPFGFKPRPHDVKAALAAVQWVPFGRPSAEPLRSAKPLYWAAELLTWTLAGGLFALAARESRVRGAGPIGWAIGPSVLLSLMIEAVQLFIPARDVDATSIALAFFGSASGAAVVARSRDLDPFRLIAPAIAIWGLAVSFTLWNPPRFTHPEPPYWRLERVVPFWSYFYSRTMADLADVIGQVVIFMPLGVLLAARPNRQSFAGAVLIGFALGVVFEFGQAFLPGRAADISDAISAAGGTAAGLALWRFGQWMRTSSTGAIRYRIARRG